MEDYERIIQEADMILSATLEAVKGMCARLHQDLGHLVDGPIDLRVHAGGHEHRYRLDIRQSTPNPRHILIYWDAMTAALIPAQLGDMGQVVPYPVEGIGSRRWMLPSELGLTCAIIPQIEIQARITIEIVRFHKAMQVMQQNVSESEEKED